MVVVGEKWQTRSEMVQGKNKTMTSMGTYRDILGLIESFVVVLVSTKRFVSQFQNRAID